MGYTRRVAVIEKRRPDRVYNAASSERPEPKMKRCEAEYSESLQPENKRPIQELAFMDKSK